MSLSTKSEKMICSSVRSLKRLPFSVLYRRIYTDRASLCNSGVVFTSDVSEDGGITQSDSSRTPHHCTSSSSFPTSSSSDLEGELEDLEALEDQEHEDVVEEDSKEEDGVRRLQSVCLPTVFLPPEMQEAVDSVLTSEDSVVTKVTVALILRSKAFRTDVRIGGCFFLATVAC